MSIDINIFTQTAKTTLKLNKYFDNKKIYFLKNLLILFINVLTKTYLLFTSL